MNIIQATNKDIDILSVLHRETLPELKWSYNKKYIAGTIRNKTRYLLKMRNETVGAIHFYHQKRDLFINTIAIFKKYQGKGYGKKLMKFAIRYAKQFNYKEISLCALREPLLSFYKVMGYKQEGVFRVEFRKKLC